MWHMSIMHDQLVGHETCHDEGVKSVEPYLEVQHGHFDWPAGAWTASCAVVVIMGRGKGILAGDAVLSKLLQDPQKERDIVDDDGMLMTMLAEWAAWAKWWVRNMAHRVVTLARSVEE